jgi:CRISPR type I-F/YPEST-associated protein Csy3
MAKTKTAIPSFLNFNRSISPSEGRLFGTSDKGEAPVEIIRRGIRGAISSYSNVYKGENADSAQNIAKQLDPKNANLQEIEVAFLPADATRLSLRFSLVFQANSVAPSGCNDIEFYGKLTKLVSLYKAAGGYNELAGRYLWNVINGRTLWRNRFATEKKVVLTLGDGTTVTFNTDNMRLDTFDRSAMPEGFEAIASKIADALSGESPDALFLTVDVSGYLPTGAEVYPSQEFISEGNKSKDKDVGKVLSSITIQHEGRTVRQATMHSQKIGNAIRVIDEWHGETDDYGATPIEAFGYIQSRNNALRLPGSKASDFYGLLKGIDGFIEELEKAPSTISGDVHYMIAMLIRGGVFSGEKK